MAYRYVAYNANGEVRKGRVEAISEEAAEEMLAGSSLTVIRLRREYQRPSLDQALPTFFGVKSGDLIPFTRDLAALLTAGIPFRMALVALRDRTTKPAFKRVLNQVAADIEAGSSFSQSLSRHPSVFPSLYLRLVQIGEEIGNLSVVLSQLTQHLEQEVAIAAKVKRALAYPILVMLVGLVAVFVMVTTVMPSLSQLFEEMEAELPLTTRMLLAVAGFLQNNFRQMIGGILVFAAALVLYLRTLQGRRYRDLALVKLPLAGSIARYSSLSRIARTFSLLMRAGVSLSESMELVVQTTGNIIVKEAMQGVRADVHMGLPLSGAIASRPLFPSLFAEMLRIGEETGKMDSNMESLASYYDRELADGIDRLVGMIEPGLILVVGLGVGFIAITMMQSVYGLIGQMK